MRSMKCLFVSCGIKTQDAILRRCKDLCMLHPYPRSRAKTGFPDWFSGFPGHTLALCNAIQCPESSESAACVDVSGTISAEVSNYHLKKLLDHLIVCCRMSRNRHSKKVENVGGEEVVSPIKLERMDAKRKAAGRGRKNAKRGKHAEASKAVVASSSATAARATRANSKRADDHAKAAKDRKRRRHLKKKMLMKSHNVFVEENDDMLNNHALVVKKEQQVTKKRIKNKRNGKAWKVYTITTTHSAACTNDPELLGLLEDSKDSTHSEEDE